MPHRTSSTRNDYEQKINYDWPYFRFRRFILLVHMKKVVSNNYGSSRSCWKPWRWVRLDLILSMRDIYINSNLNSLAKFTGSSRSIEFKDIVLWNISQMITKTVSISMQTVISHAMKQDILLWIWWKVNGNWENNMIRMCQWRESHWRTNATVRREKSKKQDSENHSVRSEN